ncbi:MAG: roadblock/LC7 domain-containing protein [Candidatus Aegiribacteria sp.]|nr:roadblock/LC7 domain-containing protein [Candidatus Aegiribacteria sp.]
MAIKDILSKLVKRSEAITALLISREGVCISKAGNVETLNSTALAALVAGMFSATREVANIVGEDQFSILLQQGEKRHIHISLIGQRNMMIVVFEDYRRIGRVRHEARTIGPDLIRILESREKSKKEDSGDISVPEFREYALNLIDRIFVVGEEENASS